VLAVQGTRPDGAADGGPVVSDGVTRRDSVGAHDPVLQVADLVVDIGTESGAVRAVDGVSFAVGRGEVLGLVGESGSGKSITALSLLRLLPDRASVIAGSVRLGDIDVLALPEDRLRSIRGRRMSMVFQDPLTSLNPLMTIGRQLIEAYRLHDGSVTRAEGRRRAAELLGTVGFPDPARVLDSYPHELSGGMRQRAVIVQAVCNGPDLLIADEPTTALDVTTQAQVLDALQAARETAGSAMLLISHDLGLVGERADRVAVMYYGRIVETGPTDEVLNHPSHPYTAGLLASRPSLKRRRRLLAIPGSPPGPLEAFAGCAFAPRCSRRQDLCTRDDPVLAPLPGRPSAAACHFAGPGPSLDGSAGSVEDRAASFGSERPEAEPTIAAAKVTANLLVSVGGLVKDFRPRARILGRRATAGVRAVDGVSFTIVPGRTLALVGESGSGKSTVARAVLRLVEPTAGSVEIDGTDVVHMGTRALRQFRTRAQLVQQDPLSALNPRMTVGDAIAEPLRVHARLGGSEVRSRTTALLESVGLRAEHARRFPHEFSGGQRQRVCIARALAPEPRLLILDEPVSSLDVSIQAQILDLLAGLQAERGLAYLFITHDLAVVRAVADDVVVLRNGVVVERGTVDEVLGSPQHPYTQALLAAVPDPSRRRSSVAVARDESGHQ